MNKKFLVLLWLSIFSVYLMAQPSANICHFYVGTYTDNGSEGIYRFGLDKVSGKLHSNGLAALSENPSYLAISKDHKYLLAVRETKDVNNQSAGYIELFGVDSDGNLSSVNMVSSGGAHPCHVAVNEDGAVVASNYSGGNVALMQIGKEGELSEVKSLAQHTGSGPVSGRQEAAHVHSSLFDPSGQRIFVADLGIDLVKVYTIDKSNFTLKTYRYPEIKLPAGSGPRHMVLHPNGKTLFIANELGCSVTVVQLLSNGGYKIQSTVSTLPSGYSNPNTCADIHLSPDGNFLYVSNRGMNSIAIFSFLEQKSTLKLLGFEETKGDMPRNFTLTAEGDFLLVANQKSDNIVAFRRDTATGMLTYTDQINANRPVCLLFN